MMEQGERGRRVSERRWEGEKATKEERRSEGDATYVGFEEQRLVREESVDGVEEGRQIREVMQGFGDLWLRVEREKETNHASVPRNSTQRRAPLRLSYQTKARTYLLSNPPHQINHQPLQPRIPSQTRQRRQPRSLDTRELSVLPSSSCSSSDLSSNRKQRLRQPSEVQLQLLTELGSRSSQSSSSSCSSCSLRSPSSSTTRLLRFEMNLMVIHRNVLRYPGHDTLDGEPVSCPSDSSSDETWRFRLEELIERDFLILEIVELIDGGRSEEVVGPSGGGGSGSEGCCGSWGSERDEGGLTGGGGEREVAVEGLDVRWRRESVRENGE